MNSAPSTVGRPPALPDADRKVLILLAAERVFDAMGYGDATMEEIARECGMAKKTVYKFYPDKAALFGALIDSHDELRDGWTARARGAEDASSHLRRLLLELSAFILSPRQLTLTRLVIAEARKSPELAERFYRECVEKTLAFVAREMAPDAGRANLDADEARLAADMFLGATLGTVQLRALMLNPDPETLRAELEARIEFATGMMLRVLAKD